jgi:hypothetical protein
MTEEIDRTNPAEHDGVEIENAALFRSRPIIRRSGETGHRITPSVVLEVVESSAFRAIYPCARLTDGLVQQV